MVRTEAEIKQIVNQYIDSLNKDLRVEKVILYGSYANGTATANSDIDIAIESPDFGDNYLKEWQKLYRYVWKSGVDPILEPRPLHHSMEPFLIEEIQKKGKVLHESKGLSG